MRRHKGHNDTTRQNQLRKITEAYGIKLQHLSMMYYPYDRHRRDELYNEVVYRLWKTLTASTSAATCGLG